jgi:WD40 repeat protein
VTGLTGTSELKRTAFSSYCLAVCASLLLSGASVFAADEKPVTFDDDVKPILRQYCWKCHGEDKQESDLNLQAFAALVRGGSGGKVVTPGRASQSRLLELITTEDADARMPPNSPPLPAEKVAILRKWIDGGLKESSTSASLAKSRDLDFHPSVGGSAKPDGPPAMPGSLPEAAAPTSHRPLPVVAMDASPWAPLVAVASHEQVRLIHLETEQELARLPFPEGEPNVIRFSRDGAILMVAGGRPVQSGKVVLFDVKSGKRLAEIGDEIDAVLSADLSPDQRLVALGGSGRVVKVYATEDGSLQYKLTKHTDWITSAAFSPDGTKLSTGDRSGGIHLWDPKTGGILLNLSEHKGAVRALDWRGDCRLLASAGEDGSVIWWDVTDGFPAVSKPNAHPPARPPGSFGLIPNGVLTARFAPNGTLVTGGRDKTVRLWSPEGNPLKSFAMDQAVPISEAVAFDGKKIVTGDSSGGVRFWKVE